MPKAATMAGVTVSPQVQLGVGDCGMEVDLGLAATTAEKRVSIPAQGRQVPALTLRKTGGGQIIVFNVRTFRKHDPGGLAQGMTDTGWLMPPNRLGLVEIDQPLIDSLRVDLLAPLKTSLSAPTKVGYYLLGDAKVLYNFRPEAAGSEAGRQGHSVAGQRAGLAAVRPSENFAATESEVMRRITKLLFLMVVLGSAAARAEVVTYPAPTDEVLSPDYEVWADAKKVDVYAARVLDPPFAGKEWDYGRPVFVRQLRHGRPHHGPDHVEEIASRHRNPSPVGRRSADMVSDNELVVTLDAPRKLSIEPDGKQGPLLLFANPIESRRAQAGRRQRALLRPRHSRRRAN